jgi:hypothetical protein
LSRADVAGGLVSANVLLASLKSEPVAVLVVRIPKTIKMDCNGLTFLHKQGESVTIPKSFLHLNLFFYSFAE